MESSPDGLSDRRISAGDEGQQRRWQIEGMTASPLARVTGGWGAGFREKIFESLKLFEMRAVSPRHCEERKRRSNQCPYFVARWIASRSLSSGAHSRDPLARNDEGVNAGTTTTR
jgi:hypothetical protein